MPLISTRRGSSANKSNLQSDHDYDYSAETSRSVPFLWERVPGVPKEHMVWRNEEEEVFTPRPPPGHWRPPLNFNKSTNDGDNDYDDTTNASETDMFSDALDKMSLSESLGVPCRLSVSKEMGPCVTRAPSFIMNRFLPAANALAASSAALSTAALPKYSSRQACSSPNDLAKPRLRDLAFADATNIRAGLGLGQNQFGDARPASPTKACGIMLSLPWTMKRAICGLKSPIRCQMPKMATPEDYTAGRSRSGGSGGDYGLGSDDGLSRKTCKSPGWGLSFLDATRMRRNGGKHRGAGLGPEIGRPLPRLQTPSDPWLANVLNSVNKRKQ